jgi:hypothetical protein
MAPSKLSQESGGPVDRIMAQTPDNYARDGGHQRRIAQQP